jgi:hypothetical protein
MDAVIFVALQGALRVYWAGGNATTVPICRRNLKDRYKWTARGKLRDIWPKRHDISLKSICAPQHVTANRRSTMNSREAKMTRPRHIAWKCNGPGTGHGAVPLYKMA